LQGEFDNLEVETPRDPSGHIDLKTVAGSRMAELPRIREPGERRKECWQSW